MMEFIKVEKKYVEEALKIALQEYAEETVKCPALIKQSFEEEIRALLTEIFEAKLGVVALEEGKVLGYIAFETIHENFFGMSKGVFSPLGASGFSGSDRKKLASRLFEEVSNALLKKQVTHYAIARYAHDDEVGRSFILNGFGIRCSDAIMKLSERKVKQPENKSIVYRELIGEEKKQIKPLSRALVLHLAHAPIFLPTDLAYFEHRQKQEQSRIFAAIDHDEVIGYMKLDDEAETFVTENKKMTNIGGAFVKPEYRGKKVADDLLEYLCQVCESEGKTYLGVDCETMNPNALRFWGKHFKAYTYSYVRRIDERCIGYDEYREEYDRKKQQTNRQ